MARVAGVELPRIKRMEIALTYIFSMAAARRRRSWVKRISIRVATATT